MHAPAHVKKKKLKFKNEKVPQTLKQNEAAASTVGLVLHYTGNCWPLHKRRDISCASAASRPPSVRQQLDKEYYLSHLHNTSHSRSNALKWRSKCHDAGTQFGSHSYTGICSVAEHMSAQQSTPFFFFFCVSENSNVHC